MWPKCRDCGSKLGRGYYLSFEDFNALLKGSESVPDEVVYCPKCGNLAVNWDGNIMFYKEESSVHNERSDNEEKKENK